MPMVASPSPRSHLLTLLLLPALMAAPGAQAETQAQTRQDVYVQTNFSAGTASFYPPAPRFLLQPFDASLGVLNGASIRWVSRANGAVTVASGTGGGSWGLEFGGAVKINDFPYEGYGGGGGFGGGPGQTVTFALDPAGREDSFTAADAVAWAAFTGTNPFSLAYMGSYPGDTPYKITTVNINGGTARVITAAVVTYSFTPKDPTAPVPGPVPLLGAAAAWRGSRRLRRRRSVGN